MIEIKNLSGTLGEFHLKDNNLIVADHEYLVLLGPTGAGKTVLIEYIIGMFKPQRGSILLNGADITDAAPEDRFIAYVPQDYALFPNMNVKKNIAYGLVARKTSPDEIERSVSKMMMSLSIDHLKNRMPLHLSGGEKQRVAIARALVTKPSIVLLDEPSLGLAPLLVKEIFEIVKKICTEEKTTILLVEQNANLALSVGHYGYVMEMGKVVLDGECAKLRENEDVKEFYLGLSAVGEKKSFKDAKHYKRRKRWLS